MATCLDLTYQVKLAAYVIAYSVPQLSNASKFIFYAADLRYETQ